MKQLLGISCGLARNELHESQWSDVHASLDRGASTRPTGPINITSYQYYRTITPSSLTVIPSHPFLKISLKIKINIKNKILITQTQFTEIKSIN